MHPAIELVLSTVTHPAFSVVTFLIGLLGGHWWALSRDRRKDYNAIAGQIRPALLAEVRPRSGITSPRPKEGLTAHDADAIQFFMGGRQRRRFREAVAEYEHAKGQKLYIHGARGSAHYTDPGLVRQAAQRLLDLVPLR